MRLSFIAQLQQQATHRASDSSSPHSLSTKERFTRLACAILLSLGSIFSSTWALARNEVWAQVKTGIYYASSPSAPTSPTSPMPAVPARSAPLAAERSSAHTSISDPQLSATSATSAAELGEHPHAGDVADGASAAAAAVQADSPDTEGFSQAILDQLRMELFQFSMRERLQGILPGLFAGDTYAQAPAAATQAPAAAPRPMLIRLFVPGTGVVQLFAPQHEHTLQCLFNSDGTANDALLGLPSEELLPILRRHRSEVTPIQVRLLRTTRPEVFTCGQLLSTLEPQTARALSDLFLPLAKPTMDQQGLEQVEKQVVEISGILQDFQDHIDALYEKASGSPLDQQHLQNLSSLLGEFLQRLHRYQMDCLQVERTLREFLQEVADYRAEPIELQAAIEHLRAIQTLKPDSDLLELAQAFQTKRLHRADAAAVASDPLAPTQLPLAPSVLIDQPLSFMRCLHLATACVIERACTLQDRLRPLFETGTTLIEQEDEEPETLDVLSSYDLRMTDYSEIAREAGIAVDERGSIFNVVEALQARGLSNKRDFERVGLLEPAAPAGAASAAASVVKTGEELKREFKQKLVAFLTSSLAAAS